jgi:acyl-coenzyme A synthetase/AMP-(fatty) acid ligase
MYGLETSVLAAMRGPVSMHDGRPFYPVDVAAALREVPPPRALVSTPVHLRALVASGLAFPRLARVLSATAPLDAGLAASLETLFGCEVVEIYGCTELGSMASRRTAVSTGWRFFAGFEANADGGTAVVAAAHLPAPVRLPDKLEFGDDGSFLLVGRDSDLVKVGGKRTSIAEVTRLIMAIPGVTDAVVFSPTEESAAVRLAAFVVSPSADAEAVRSALRLVLDPVFIPRPILMVAALPRGATGKLAHDVVRRMFAEGAGTGARDG